MTNQTYRQALGELARLSVDLIRSRPHEIAARIANAIDDGTGAVACDSDQVTGGGATQTTTERLALGLPDRARADAAEYTRLIGVASDALRGLQAIGERWPEQMPRKERAIDAPANDCGVCGAHVTGIDSDRIRTIQAPTPDGTPRPVGACDACRQSWARLVRLIKAGGWEATAASWREWAERRRNDRQMASAYRGGVA